MSRNPLSRDNLLPPVADSKNIAGILAYLKETKEGRVETTKELKLIVVGKAGSGKTTMLCRCQKRDDIPSTGILSTDGVELGTLILEDLKFQCFDFGGQVVFRYSHQLFLTDQSICLVVFDLKLPKERNFDEIEFWLQCLKRRAPNALCLLIGTHCKKVGNADERCLKYLKEMEYRFPSIKIGGSVAIDSVEGLNLSKLQKAIITLARKQVFKIFFHILFRLNLLSSLISLAPFSFLLFDFT